MNARDLPGSEQDAVASAQPLPATASEPEEGEVPGGYSDRGGSDRCDECIFFTARGDAAAESRMGLCLVHGPPPYLVAAGGWCPAWEPIDGDLPVFG